MGVFLILFTSCLSSPKLFKVENSISTISGNTILLQEMLFFVFFEDEYYIQKVSVKDAADQIAYSDDGNEYVYFLKINASKAWRAINSMRHSIAQSKAWGQDPSLNQYLLVREGPFNLIIDGITFTSDEPSYVYLEPHIIVIKSARLERDIIKLIENCSELSIRGHIIPELNLSALKNFIE